MKKRNYNIDFLRGIATIWIIVIHTAFWSGEAYLPAWFKNLTLLLDVPAFMYIAGLSFTYNNSFMKTLKGLLEIWKKWLYFLIFYIIILLISKDYAFFKDIFCWIFYYFPHETSLIVVQGSIWFILMYFEVSIFCSLVICLNNYFTKTDSKRNSNLLAIIMIVFFIFGYTSFAHTNMILSATTAFYSLMFLVGYISSSHKINFKKALICSIINLAVLLIIFYLNHYKLSDLQTLKFPPSFPYLFVANFSIIAFWYLKDKLKIKKTNIINYVGQRAIFFYFSQGIAASFLIKIYNFMPSINKYLIFLIMLTINIFLSTMGAFILEKSYNFLKEKFHKIKI